MPIDLFIGAQIRSLIHELTLLSGKRFREECYLLPGEELGPERRAELGVLDGAKLSIARSLDELVARLHSIGQLLFGDRVDLGYERVAEKYVELLMQRWLIIADRYKEGYDPEPNREFRTCAYGLIEVDPVLLDELRSALEEAEEKTRETSLPDFVDPFRLDYLTNDLTKAGLPIAGANGPQQTIASETDVTPCEYFRLEDNNYVRVTMPRGIALSQEQRDIASRIILDHEKVAKRHAEICEVVHLGLKREGHRVTSLRLNRSESELTFDPARFVSVDTEVGILEIRTRESLQVDQREQIRRIARERLASCGIKAFIPPTLDDTRRELKEFKNYVERQAHDDIFVDGKPQESIARSLLQAYLKPRSYREVPVRGGKTDILLFAGQGRFLFETKIWRGPEYYEQGLREIEEYVIGEGNDLGLGGVFYVLFDPTKSCAARAYLGDDFASTIVCGCPVDVVVVSLLPPPPSKKV